MLRAIRRLLAESSRRGRIASAALASLALALGVVALILLFPQRDDPRIELALATADPTVDYPSPLRVWPGMRVVVSGQRLTEASPARVLLDGRRLGTFITSPAGELNALVTLPGELTPGERNLVVQDAGTGRLLRAPLFVEDQSRPGVAVQPDSASAGAAVVVAGGGLPSAAPVRVVLHSGGDTTPLRRGRTTRAGLLVLLVLLPDDVAAGDHAVEVIAPDGALLAPAAPVRVTG